MINSICSNQQALERMSENVNLSSTIKDFIPTKDDFEYLNELADLLCHLYEFITVIGASNYPVLSLLYPLGNSSKKNLLGKKT